MTEGDVELSTDEKIEEILGRLSTVEQVLDEVYFDKFARHFRG